jgi:hypothetical protein
MVQISEIAVWLYVNVIESVRVTQLLINPVIRTRPVLLVGCTNIHVIISMFQSNMLPSFSEFNYEDDVTMGI